MLEGLHYDKLIVLSGGTKGQRVGELLRKVYGGSGTLRDRENAFLKGKGFTTGTRVDKWCRYLGVKNGHAAMDKLRSLSVLP